MLLIRTGDLVLERDADNGVLTGTELGDLTTSLGYNSFGEFEKQCYKRWYQVFGKEIWQTCGI